MDAFKEAGQSRIQRDAAKAVTSAMLISEGMTRVTSTAI